MMMVTVFSWLVINAKLELGNIRALEYAWRVRREVRHQGRMANSRML